MQRNFLIIIFITCYILSVYSQKQNTIGNWLVNRTPPMLTVDEDTQKKQYEDLATLINSLLEKNIVPQAMDRNIVGEMIIISQTSPPAPLAKNWVFQLYKNEKEMLQDIKTKSKEQIYPIGFDVQKDGAFVFFVQSRLNMKGLRFIKVNKKQLEKSIEDYLILGFIPLAISSFETSIWILFARFEEIDTNNIEIQIRISPIDNLGEILDETLQNTRSQVIAFTTLNENEMIVLFRHQNK